MTLRKYRRIGQLAVGAVFANRMARRWPRGALADGNKWAGPAEFNEKDVSGLFVTGDAGSILSGVSLQGHDEPALHDAEHCVASSC